MIRKGVHDSCGEIFIKSEAEEHIPKVFYCIWSILTELTEQLLHINCAGKTKGGSIINNSRGKYKGQGNTPIVIKKVQSHWMQLLQPQTKLHINSMKCWICTEKMSKACTFNTSLNDFKRRNVTGITEQQQRSDFDFSLSYEKTNTSKMSSNRGSHHTKILLRNHNGCRKLFEG